MTETLEGRANTHFVGGNPNQVCCLTQECTHCVPAGPNLEPLTAVPLGTSVILRSWPCTATGTVAPSPRTYAQTTPHFGGGNLNQICWANTQPCPGAHNRSGILCSSSVGKMCLTFPCLRSHASLLASSSCVPGVSVCFFSISGDKGPREIERQRPRALRAEENGVGSSAPLPQVSREETPRRPN